MKNLLKYTFTLFVLAGLSNTVFAQQTEYNSNVDVSATVNSIIVLTPTNINLGIIVEDIASTIAANGSDGATETNLGFGASAGALNITGSADQSILVSWANATLDVVALTDPVIFTPSVWNGAAQLTTPAGSTTSITGGDVTLDIGGTLAAVANPGTYSTTNGTPIAFTVSYN